MLTPHHRGSNSTCSLDYGVRWDFYGSPRYNDGYMWNWNPTTGAVVVAPGTLTFVNQYYPTNIKVAEGSTVPRAKTTNFLPRAAAAYRLSDNLVLRGGFSEFLDGGGFGGANGRINDPNGPFQITETYFNSDNNGVIGFAWPNAFPTTLSSSLVGPQNVNALPQHTDEGVIRQYNVTLERAWSGFILRGSLIGARGVGMNDRECQSGQAQHHPNNAGAPAFAAVRPRQHYLYQWFLALRFGAGPGAEARGAGDVRFQLHVRQQHQ